MSRARRVRQRPKKRSVHPRRRSVVLIAAAVAVGVAVVIALVMLYPSGGQSEPRAAIVDQLSLTAPNPTFAVAATDMLEQAGYAVDYYPGERVTVDFYRTLPSHGYDFLVLRVHSTPTGVGAEATDDASLYTTEPYTQTKYLDEQVTRRLTIVSYYEGGPEYFAIPPDFIRSSMRGEFDDTTVIIMGCDGLRSSAAAEAFVQRGAKAVVSWSGPVSANHTDAATERLLQHLLVDGLPIHEAIAVTMADVGPDPQYESTLRAYP